MSAPDPLQAAKTALAGGHLASMPIADTIRLVRALAAALEAERAIVAALPLGRTEWIGRARRAEAALEAERERVRELEAMRQVAALAAERAVLKRDERIVELESDNLVLTKQRDYEVDQVRQRDERIAALQAGLRDTLPHVDLGALVVLRPRLEELLGPLPEQECGDGGAL